MLGRSSSWWHQKLHTWHFPTSLKTCLSLIWNYRFLVMKTTIPMIVPMISVNPQCILLKWNVLQGFCKELISVRRRIWLLGSSFLPISVWITLVEDFKSIDQSKGYHTLKMPCDLVWFNIEKIIWILKSQFYTNAKEHHEVH